MHLGIVGNGNIAKFHVEAFTRFGLKPEYLISKNGSKSAVSFADKYSISKHFKEKEFLKKNIIKQVHGLILACDTQNITKYLDLCRDNNVWALAEKPVSFDLNKLRSYSNFNFGRVAFNRRFYPNIGLLKSKLEKANKKTFIDLYMPETKIKSNEFGKTFHQIFSNSVHGIDIVLYICNELKIEAIKKLMNNGSRIIHASNERFDVRINFLLDTPTNFSMKVYGLKKLYDLTPFEVLSSYKNLEYSPPTEKYPVAQYKPKVEEIITAISEGNEDIKPGFFEQAQAFVETIGGKVNTSLPKIKDALHAQTFLQKTFDDVI